MNWKEYNDDNTLKGLEGRYRILNKTLQIEFTGANHFWDWVKCIFQAFFSISFKGLKFHPAFMNWADNFYCNIIYGMQYDIDTIEIKGLSMGGAVGECLAWILFNFTESISIILETYGSPKACKNADKYITIPSGKKLITKRYYNKGDIVPFLPPWFSRYKRILLNKKWQNPIKAHSQYDWRFKS